MRRAEIHPAAPRGPGLAAIACVLACASEPVGPDGGAGERDATLAVMDASATPDARANDDAADFTDGALADAAAEPDASALDAAPSVDAAPASDAAMSDAGVAIVDLDQDGLDDREEDRVAREYLPYLAIDPADECPRMIALFRLRPHPLAAGRLHMIVDHLFETDCGPSGHPGDNEVFGVTIDPSRPAPEGILAIKAIAHQSTVCDEATSCGQCAPLMPCSTAPLSGAMFPVVFFSKDKHGAYTSEMECDGSCFLTNYCAPATVATVPRLFNAGEPGAPLIRDLTAAGAITSTAGWTEPTLFGFDPWGASDFGDAGNVAEDLTDDSFLTPSCGP